MLQHLTENRPTGTSITTKYLYLHLVFKVQAPCWPNLNPLDFYLWGHLKTILCLAQIANEEKLDQPVFDACQTIRTPPPPPPPPPPAPTPPPKTPLGLPRVGGGMFGAELNKG